MFIRIKANELLQYATPDFHIKFGEYFEGRGCESIYMEIGCNLKTLERLRRRIDDAIAEHKLKAHELDEGMKNELSN